MNWTVFRRLVAAYFRDRSQFTRPRPAFTCPICRYHGPFISVGVPARFNARCPQCGARERHRLTHLYVTEGGADKLAGKRILHFAPEKANYRMMRGNPLYETADLRQTKGVTHRGVDMRATPFPNNSYDVLIAHHVLEHIDEDRQAMAELFRILKPGGCALLSVPINPSRADTYENYAVKQPAERRLHFLADDHRRIYGLDFQKRLEEAGFKVDTFRMPFDAEIEYGLLRDEWIFIARKTGAS
ncbi:MAG: methyltransferase domain-containing protein [Parvularculaceae bacterium]